MSRGWHRWLLLIAVAGMLTVACSQTGRHRLATFLFDGVPPLESPVDLPRSAEQTVNQTVPSGAEASRVIRRIYAHTPYKQNRCQGCHDPVSGQLVRTLEEGLCLTCHDSLIRDLRYQHGPTAAGACAFCHHYHTAPNPNQLLEPPTALCLQCHERDDLTKGPHHTDIDTRTCTECHDPHGGSNQFFVKQEGT